MAEQQTAFIDACSCCDLMETTRFYRHKRMCSMCASMCPPEGPCNVTLWLMQGGPGHDKLAEELTRTLEEEDQQA